MITNSDGASELTVLYEHVLEAAGRIVGDPVKAALWCEHEHIACIDGKTAKELVAENRGADVLRFLRSLDAGVAG
jgi:hypothetical protein